MHPIALHPNILESGDVPSASVLASRERLLRSRAEVTYQKGQKEDFMNIVLKPLEICLRDKLTTLKDELE